VRERVYKIISQVFNVPIENINDETSSDDIETWDSLKHMNMVLSLEEEFNVQFGEEQVLEMLNVGLIIEILKEIG
jgi:acyl carrier protein|tara:strand:+ start:143 stop:367 length:225 start_codon:yes stop_codon:yes gene_type:complete